MLPLNMSAMLADVNRCASAVISGLVFAAICVILRHRGYVVAAACLFVASCASTQILMSALGAFYRHPGAVTTLHLFCVWLTCLAHRLVVGRGNAAASSETRTTAWFVRKIFPIALSLPLTVVFNNTALVYAGAAICAILGTLSPVSVALMSFACGRKLSKMSWMGILVAFLGALVLAGGEATSIQTASAPEKTFLGILFALAAVGTRTMKIVVMDVLLAPGEYSVYSSQPEQKEAPLSPMQLYSLQAPWCVLIAFLYTACTESFFQAAADLTWGSGALIFLTCVSAVSLNFLGLVALKELGASSQQIIGKLNTVCVAAISVGYLNEELSRTVILGGVVVLAGAAIVERGKGQQPLQPLQPPSKV
ncbi:unnamed protein product [Symbiodinium natans]|uniref:EamA domain-containing protein n=1 Tax=Symbiodinium natans TaxID=878477 RepID=A0A812L978_9DINO|nr:unnamed protein product [Symbiodinium natans]